MQVELIAIALADRRAALQRVEIAFDQIEHALASSATRSTAVLPIDAPASDPIFEGLPRVLKRDRLLAALVYEMLPRTSVLR